jgi:hypothetical protein
MVLGFFNFKASQSLPIHQLPDEHASPEQLCSHIHRQEANIIQDSSWVVSPRPLKPEGTSLKSGNFAIALRHHPQINQVYRSIIANRYCQQTEPS